MKLKKLLFYLLLTVLFIGCSIEVIDNYSKIGTRETMLLNRIIDGDTLEFYSNGEKITCRINGIDTPEKYDSSKLDYIIEECGYSAETVKHLGELATDEASFILDNGEYYSVEIVDIDEYERYVCRVELEKNYYYAQEIIKSGYAVVKEEYLDYNRSVIYQDLEKFAKDNKKGLWYNYADFMECLTKL
jgi:endonuclease YncB( thermonuclease family)